ncbi:hypothetical protein PENANT_c001G00074 [Penicillium antarcticum]|uniref:Nephrocystin 3-like N-terminal domain-containing protein n=1 Tax=Penicillium antarcticum TaxID=416450 RepID=A0A1V6QMW9_9EURO|nr:hypothetical protein PENANT_c001G00074 [Penicillium antarcticum]
MSRAQILDVAQELVLAMLPDVKDAASFSHKIEHDAGCHCETRIALRDEIVRWSDDTEGEIIFWLNGMAGTGKSIISRTIAQTFPDKVILGAKFFIKRGERDRGNAARPFATMACQLVVQKAALAPKIQDAISKDPEIVNRSLKDQIEQLFLNPLVDLEYHAANIRTAVLPSTNANGTMIIHLMSRGTILKLGRLKVFLTSMPELPIRLSFEC